MSTRKRTITLALTELQIVQLLTDAEQAAVRNGRQRRLSPASRADARLRIDTAKQIRAAYYEAPMQKVRAAWVAHRRTKLAA